MERSKFTEEQIIAILGEQAAGATVADLCRQHGMSSATRVICRAGGFRTTVIAGAGAIRLSRTPLTARDGACKHAAYQSPQPRHPA